MKSKITGDDENFALPMLRRAAGLVNGRRLSLVKMARRREHLLFDVPVVGLSTIPVMRETSRLVG